MNLYIELANTLTLQFRILDTPVAKLWLDRMALRNQYPLDHPNRFYGFNPAEKEQSVALSMIQSTINTINNYSPIITRQISSAKDQDTLNYLHNIFERYHGLLDQQAQEFFVNAPPEVKRALADLNIDVHRCEAVIHGNYPRFVCTWYGLPKTETLDDELIKQYGTLSPKFASVCLNYCEIGKTLDDLTRDRDNYIADEAFKPFSHYSADFNVIFYEETPNEIADRINKLEKYYFEHYDFFCKHGYPELHDPRLLPLRFPVAELVETMPREQLLQEIQQRQQITKVTIE